MRYFWIILLIASSVQAYPRKFYYEGEIYSMDWDTEEVSSDFFSQCRKQVVYWRDNRTKDQKQNPQNHIPEYLDATYCDRVVAKGIADRLWKIFPGTEKKTEYANFITAFVNSYFYKYDTNNPEYEFEDPSYKNIFDTFNYSGDCEDLALLLTALFANSCLDTAFLVWDGHASSSVCVPAQGTYVEDAGKEYFIVEPVGGGGTKYAPWKVGEKSNAMKGSIKKFVSIGKRNCQ